MPVANVIHPWFDLYFNKQLCSIILSLFSDYQKSNQNITIFFYTLCHFVILFVQMTMIGKHAASMSMRFGHKIIFLLRLWTQGLVKILKLKLRRDFAADAWSRTLWYDLKNDFGKLSSTLESVVPLAMFLSSIVNSYISSDDWENDWKASPEQLQGMG